MKAKAVLFWTTDEQPGDPDGWASFASRVAHWHKKPACDCEQM
ncbi:MAG: hypothetical protein ABSA85_17990 [Terracidiphilus sp.]